LDEEEPGRLGRAGMLVAGLVALVVAGAVLVLVPASLQAPEFHQVPLRELGRLLASSYAVALVILGLLVGATIVGGLTLVRIEREEKPSGATQ
jgi:NADH:ubiquinone oxidoreductase subunit 6 (subunit J)